MAPPSGEICFSMVLIRTRTQNLGMPMKFDDETLDRIFHRTDGQCHICRKRLSFSNYGLVGKRGAWEVEHSRPRSKGGTNHRNNLYTACISCNRSKGNGTTASARAANGYRTAPLSEKKKNENAWAGGGRRYACISVCSASTAIGSGRGGRCRGSGCGEVLRA